MPGQTLHRLSIRAFFVQQRARVGRHGVSADAGGLIQAQAALRVIHVAGGGVIERVAVFNGAGRLAVKNLELARQRDQLLGAARGPA